jgi:hypothetical protein
MGTVTALLSLAIPITTWVSATYSWVSSRMSTSGVSSFFQLAELPISRGAVLLTRPEQAGGDEVNS